MIVKKDFYLHSTKKSYKKGTEFKGSTKGREHLLCTKKEFDAEAKKAADANKKIEAADAKRTKPQWSIWNCKTQN